MNDLPDLLKDYWLKASISLIKGSPVEISYSQKDLLDSIEAELLSFIAEYKIVRPNHRAGRYLAYMTWKTYTEVFNENKMLQVEFLLPNGLKAFADVREKGICSFAIYEDGYIEKLKSYVDIREFYQDLENLFALT
jgi:hypothetical protein